MATNPIGRGTQNVTVNMEKTLLAKLDDLAKRTGVSRNQYLAGILNEAAESGALVHVVPQVVRPLNRSHPYTLNDDPEAPPPKRKVG